MADTRWRFRGGGGLGDVQAEFEQPLDPVKTDWAGDWRAGAQEVPGLREIVAPPTEPVGGQPGVPLTSDLASGEGALDYASTRPPAAALPATEGATMPEPDVLSLDDAVDLVQASQGSGAVVDRAAVARLGETRAARQKNLRDQAGRERAYGQQAGESGAAVAGMLAQQGRELDDYAAETQRENAARAQETARRRAAVEAKSKEAEQAAADIDSARLMRGGGGVMWAIAAALGAFGATIARTPNYALEMMQSALDRDLEAQKEGARGKREAASFAKDTYEGFLREGQDAAQARANTEAVMSRAWAVKIAAQAKGLESAEQQVAAERLGTQFMDNALAQQEAADALAAKPRGGGKRQTKAEQAAEALKLEKQAIENAAARQKLTGGGSDVAIADAPQKRVQDKLGAIDAFQTTMDDLKQWKDGGNDYLPGAGGARDVPDTVVRKGRKLIKGGTGFTGEQQRIDSSLKLAGYQAYIASAHNAPNSTPEREQAEASMWGNGETEAAQTNIRRAAEKQFLEAQNEVDAMPAGRTKELFQNKLNTARQKWDRKHSSTADTYRARFGSGGQ
jgi:hypothetical protein